MKKLILCLFAWICVSCNDNPSCMTYQEALDSGRVDRKTTMLHLRDSLKLELDYVREMKFKDKIPFCYGQLKLDEQVFQKAVAHLAADYISLPVLKIELLCGERDACHNVKIDATNIQALLVYYTDKQNKIRLDYVSLETGETETQSINNAHCRISMYYLFDRTGIKKHPALIALINKAADTEQLNYMEREEALYPEPPKTR